MNASAAPVEHVSPPTRARTVSVVSPVFNEQEGLERFYRRTRAALEQCGLDGFELIFVDDGSTDGTSAILARLASADRCVKVLRLSRNFGHHPAVFAGLEFASGEVVVVLDADLQDPPELIPQLVARRNEGYPLVFGRRQGTREGTLLKALKKAFRTLMRRVSKIEFPEHVGVFSTMDRHVVELLLAMPERSRYLVAMQMYLGFPVGYVDYQREERAGGRPKQGLPRLFRLGFNSIFSYSSLPLRLSMLAGMVCLIAALIGIGIVLYHKLVLRVAMTGWTSVMVAILGMGAVQLLSLWMICEYIERVFENTKGRPYFVVWQQVGTRGIATESVSVPRHSPALRAG